MRKKTNGSREEKLTRTFFPFLSLRKNVAFLFSHFSFSFFKFLPPFPSFRFLSFYKAIPYFYSHSSFIKRSYNLPFFSLYSKRAMKLRVSVIAGKDRSTFSLPVGDGTNTIKWLGIASMYRHFRLSGKKANKISRLQERCLPKRVFSTAVPLLPPSVLQVYHSSTISHITHRQTATIPHSCCYTACCAVDRCLL